MSLSPRIRAIVLGLIEEVIEGIDTNHPATVAGQLMGLTVLVARLSELDRTTVHQTFDELWDSPDWESKPQEVPLDSLD